MTADADETPVDEIAVATALRNLDKLIMAHPELTGPRDEDNVQAWVSTLTTDEETTMAKEKEPTTQVAFRLPDSLIKRLDQHVARMDADNPGLTFARVDAVRLLLTRALDQVEGAKRGGKG